MIRAVAIDDEPIALNILLKHCSEYDIKLHCYSSPAEGMRAIEKLHPDIVFLDIEMHGANGIELAKDILPDTAVIFTSAFSQYAFDGYEVDAVDFLHKPIFYPRFERAVNKALKWLGNTENNKGPVTLTLKVDHKNLVINVAEITHIEAMDNYVKVYRRGNKRLIVSQIPLKEVENMLPADRFVRVHRSFLVAVTSIESYSAKEVKLIDIDTPIPVGRTFASRLEDLT